MTFRRHAKLNSEIGSDNRWNAVFHVCGYVHPDVELSVLKDTKIPEKATEFYVHDSCGHHVFRRSHVEVFRHRRSVAIGAWAGNDPGAVNRLGTPVLRAGAQDGIIHYFGIFLSFIDSQFGYRKWRGQTGKGHRNINKQLMTLFIRSRLVGKARHTESGTPGPPPSSPGGTAPLCPVIATPSVANGGPVDRIRTGSVKNVRWNRYASPARGNGRCTRSPRSLSLPRSSDDGVLTL